MSDAGAMNMRNGKRERVEVKEARPRRGGATRAQIVTEAEILKIIGKLKGANKYDGLERMLKQLLVLQVECTVGDLSAFKIWLKLAKDSKRSLAEGTDALAVLLEAHPAAAGVQEEGCAALWNLAVNAENQVKIAAAGGIEAILAAAQAEGAVVDLASLPSEEADETEVIDLT